MQISAVSFITLSSRKHYAPKNQLEHPGTNGERINVKKIQIKNLDTFDFVQFLFGDKLRHRVCSRRVKKGHMNQLVGLNFSTSGKGSAQVPFFTNKTNVKNSLKDQTEILF